MSDRNPVRNTDPSTSYEAAASIDVSELEGIVLDAHHHAGDKGLTWDETAAVTGIDKASVSPRFAPLMRKNLLKIKRAADGSEVKRSTGRSGRNQLVRVVCS